MTPPGCSEHAALIARATGPDPSDDDLERYADDVPGCPQCQRALAVALQVHPMVLEQGGTRPASEGFARATDPQLEGRRALYAALNRRPWTRRLAPIAVAAAAVLLIGAMVSRPWWNAAPDGPETSIHEVVIVPPAPPVRVEALPQPIPTLAEPRVETLVEVQRLVPPRRAVLDVPPLPAVDDDGVAIADDADDWPAPPFENLRDGSAKGVGTPPQVRVLLSGSAPRSVRDAVTLSVVADQQTSIAVCVSGPERGVVWRGAIPAGRTELSRDGRLQSFGFASAGTYTFAVSTADLERCDDPVQRVTVEVAP